MQRYNKTIFFQLSKQEFGTSSYASALLWRNVRSKNVISREIIDKASLKLFLRNSNPCLNTVFIEDILFVRNNYLDLKNCYQMNSVEFNSTSDVHKVQGPGIVEQFDDIIMSHWTWCMTTASLHVAWPWRATIVWPAQHEKVEQREKIPRGVDLG